MMGMKKRLLFLFAFLVLLELVWHAPLSGRGSPAAYAQAALTVGSATVSVGIADSDEERIQGLSGIASLGAQEGLLFVFDQPDRYGFWMKDMRFPIDIIWIGEDRRVVDITRSATPETYPARFMPSAPAQYVLEVNEGWSDAHGIVVGDHVGNLTFAE